jgi:TolB-like protein
VPARTLTTLSAACLTLALVSNPAFAEIVRVALLPVVVHTSDPESGYVSDGLGDMLAARIERSGEVSVLRIANIATTNSPDAILAAREAGAAYVLYGSFTQFGDGASLDIRCAPVSDANPSEETGARHIFIQTGTLQEIIPKLDDLSDKIIRYLVSGAERIAARPDGKSTGALPSVAGQSGTDSMNELRARVDALERAVYSGTSEL